MGFLTRTVETGLYAGNGRVVQVLPKPAERSS